MVNDTIADLLIRLNNAQRARHRLTEVPSTKFVRSVLEVLKAEGLVESFRTKTTEGQVGSTLEVALKYFRNGDPVIRRARRMSKPGRRIYGRSQDLKPISSGLGVSIISTSQGVMSDREARKRKIGGEVLAIVGS